MTAPTEKQIEEARTILHSLDTTRKRLRAAGQRVAIADAMRSAAIAEMGQAIRDHRALLDTATGRRPAGHRIQMDDAEELTGLSRRTLSEAVGKTDVRSDAELAIEYQSYDYDLYYGGEELHRRYPQLAALYEARMLLAKAESERWHEEHPNESGFGPVEPTQGQLVLQDEYRRRVSAIAEGRPLC
ncbi:hypothetical protein ACFY4C_41875 [Actinomadura viridis]|uniref:hypothetical protein n=1 Tax=Actinomadura viridis TaxID=58110 RepID=UPI0036C090E8